MKKIEVKCNYCGREIDIDFEEHLECNYQFGYGTTLDGIKLEFDLCEDCLIKLFALFKHIPCVARSDALVLENQHHLEQAIKQLREKETILWKGGDIN